MWGLTKGAIVALEMEGEDRIVITRLKETAYAKAPRPERPAYRPGGTRASDPPGNRPRPARPQEGWAVVGIGVNVAVRLAELPPELRDSAATLGLEPRAV